ncbi:MAG: site-specific DNA-methyltransferase [Synergistaceae bacterium]|nr:site-specific DNA-methyltransferase [Synergistaceae bacterium]
MKYGEIIELGRHKLMCGDATSREDVMRLVDGVKVDLVLTDPPYGIRILGNGSRGSIGSGGRIYPTIIGDNGIDMMQEHYHIARILCNNMVIWGGQKFTEFLPLSCGWIFWDKEKGSDKLLFGDGELAYANILTRIKKYSYKWNGNNIAGDSELNARVHPTQKPVELHMRILEDFSKPGDIILDCFGGSGTTLIACEMTGRKCLMMEISPEYCDIITERYHKLMDGKLPLEVANA